MGKSRGFIKLWREIIDHWIFQDPLFLRAWIWMLIKAKYAENGSSTRLRLGNRA